MNICPALRHVMTTDVVGRRGSPACKSTSRRWADGDGLAHNVVNIKSKRQDAVIVMQKGTGR